MYFKLLRRIGFLAIMTAMMGSCMEGEAVPCGQAHCLAGYQCVLERCVAPGALFACGNGIVNVGEVCDDANTASGDGCSADCRSNETCGNGILDEERGEICDDGNTSNRDGCPPSCKFDCNEYEELGYWVCQDKLSWQDARDVCRRYGADLLILDDVEENFRVAGILSPGRFWVGLSDGTQESTFRWVDNLALSDELHGFWMPGEPNDGNSIGDGEDCIEGNADVIYGIRWSDLLCTEEQRFVCELPPCTDCQCGNGELERGEDCDDGNTMPGDGCDAICGIESICGNGSIEPGEDCDDGNTMSDDGCDAICRYEGVCGDSWFYSEDEECDDGNTMSGDGCSDTCTIEGIREMEPNEDGSLEINEGSSSPVDGNDFSTMSANGPYEADTIIVATLDPAGDEDVFAIRNRGSNMVRVRFETYDPVTRRDVPCTLDTVLHIRDDQGNSLIFNDDDPIRGGYCSMVEQDILPNQTVYAHVFGYGDNIVLPEPGYGLMINFP